MVYQETLTLPQSFKRKSPTFNSLRKRNPFISSNCAPVPNTKSDPREVPVDKLKANGERWTTLSVGHSSDLDNKETEVKANIFMYGYWKAYRFG